MGAARLDARRGDAYGFHGSVIDDYDVGGNFVSGSTVAVLAVGALAGFHASARQ